jgi:hypothetical protein
MSKIGFWDSLVGDVGYYERKAINSNSADIDVLKATQNASLATLRRQVHTLYSMDQAQSMELARLRVMVRVLAEMVAEQGAGDVLAKRMEDALDGLEAEQTKAAAEVKSAEPTTVCTRCQNTVLARRTVITFDGNVCDACFY